MPPLRFHHKCLIAAAVLTTTAAPGFAGALLAEQGEIRYPNERTPAAITHQNTFAVQVVPRLPLTPPPGVQQPAANTGWSVVLSRDGIAALDGPPNRLEYALRVMRIRPVTGDVYRVITEAPPWLPDGIYDVTVSGPGFHRTAHRAVQKGDQAALAGGEATLLDGERLAVLSPSTEARTTRFALYVPASISALLLTHEGRALRPHSVLPARLPDSGARLAMFEIPSTPTPQIIHIERRAPAPCDLQISWDALGTNRTLEWRNLTVESPKPVVSAVWELGDGRHGIGTAVRHRFLLSNQAEVVVRAYDGFATACTESVTIPLNPLRLGTGCGCDVVGR